MPSSKPAHIAICAPAAPITAEDAALVTRLAAAHFPQATLHIHPQCFAADGHFAGTDATRLAAFLDCANDPTMDAVWFGYSDMGYLLGALYRAGIGQPAHGPMLADIRRENGDAAILRALAYLCGDRSGLEASLHTSPHKHAAFNLITLAMLCGTPLMPGLAGHVVMVEEVSEHLYAVDRLFFHITAHLGGVAGLKLGRISDVPENDRPFGATPRQIAQDWCQRHAIAFLGMADIGHDAANRIVPFGITGA